MLNFRRLAVSAGLCAAIAIAGTATAARALDLGVGETALILLKQPARSVVIGNPAVADVSVESPGRLMVFGKRPGGTTLTVLGSGAAVLRTDIVVHPGMSSGVTVTYASGKGVAPGGATVVYACGAGCARAAEVKPSDFPDPEKKGN